MYVLPSTSTTLQPSPWLMNCGYLWHGKRVVNFKKTHKVSEKGWWWGRDEGGKGKGTVLRFPTLGYKSWRQHKASERGGWDWGGKGKGTVLRFPTNPGGNLEVSRCVSEGSTAAARFLSASLLAMGGGAV